MVSLVKQDDADTLRQLFATDFIPSNPTNMYGESMASLACRFGSVQVLHLFLKELGVKVSVADSSGRTCLHEACWSAQVNWNIVQLLLDHDVHLLLVSDSHGKLPFDYCNTHEDITTGWIQFLDRMKDEYWPLHSENKEFISPVFVQQPNQSPNGDPLKNTTAEMEHAHLLASGRIHPAEIAEMFRSGTSLDLLNEEEDEPSTATGYDDGHDDTSYLSQSGTSFNYDALESEMLVLLDALDDNFRQVHFKSYSSRKLRTEETPPVPHLLDDAGNTIMEEENHDSLTFEI
jgi:ankyrin repeat protein